MKSFIQGQYVKNNFHNSMCYIPAKPWQLNLAFNSEVHRMTAHISLSSPMPSIYNVTTVLFNVRKSASSRSPSCNQFCNHLYKLTTVTVNDALFRNHPRLIPLTAELLSRLFVQFLLPSKEAKNQI